MKMARTAVAKTMPAQAPAAWPAISIALLTVIAAIFPPALITALVTYLLVLAVIVWTNSGKRLDAALLWAIGPFFLIIAIGLLVGVGAEKYLYLKDAWYVTNPALIISVGYVFFHCMPDVSRGLRAFVIGGTLLSLLFLIPFVIYPKIIFYSADQIRSMVGGGYIGSALAFTILCAYYGMWEEALKLRPWIAATCLFICTLSMVASFSRTMIVVAFLGILAACGVFARRELRRIAVILLALVLVFGALKFGAEFGSSGGRQTFLGKLARSLDEITVQEYSDPKSINQNWRGFETARAMNLIFSGPVSGLVIGHGFGTQVDLGAVVMMGKGGDVMHQIPILHNGYAYLFIKGGALAVVAYVVSLFWLYIAGRRKALHAIDGTSVGARVLQAIALSLAITTWVISGAFNKMAVFPLLLAAGFLLAAVTQEARAQK